MKSAAVSAVKQQNPISRTGCMQNILNCAWRGKGLGNPVRCPADSRYGCNSPLNLRCMWYSDAERNAANSGIVDALSICLAI